VSEALRQAIQLRIRGRVQGVGFRHFTVRRARALGVTGWVRNLPDGSVELAAAGTPEALEQLAAAVSQGPPAARVSGVEREKLDPPPSWERFEVSFA
jgi:acylphosphatase